MQQICDMHGAERGLEAACLATLVILKHRCTYGMATIGAVSRSATGRMIDVELTLPHMSFAELLIAVDRCLQNGPEKGPEDTPEVIFAWEQVASSKPGHWFFQPRDGCISVKAPSGWEQEIFRALFDRAPHYVNTNIWDLPLVHDDVKQQVKAWGEPRHNMEAYRSNTGQLLTFPEVFAEAASPAESIAISGKGFELTYGTLRLRVAAVSNALQSAMGATPSKGVAVYMGRGESIAPAFFGVLQAGCFVVPVDLHWPAERVRSVVADSSATLALTDASSDVAWQNMTGLPKSLVVDAELFTQYEGSPGQHQSVNPNQPAIVLFTSGSTGKPKGIVLSHGYVMTLAAGRAESLGMTEKTRTLMHQSPTWMPFIDYLFGPMLGGGACVFAPEPPAGRGITPADLRSMVLDHGATILGFVPPVLDIFLDEDVPADLKCICVGGAAVPAELSLRAISCFQKRKETSSIFIATGYHGTEQGDVTQIQLRSKSDVDALSSEKGFMTSGRPHTTQRVAVLDQAFQMVGPEGIGEICVAGCGLASGYLNMPEKTAETFLPNCAALGGERTMRTSDLGRWTADGSLEVVGRRDSMVKVRGARVELGEVEVAVSMHPDVRACVVVVHQDRLVAYVSPAVPGDLRDLCKSRLASYMVPHVFQGLEELPQLSNGKINKKALPPPTESEDSSEVIMELDSLGQMRKLTRMSVSEDRILDNVRSLLMIIVIQSHATPLKPHDLGMLHLEPDKLHGHWSYLAYILLTVTRSGGWSALAFMSGYDETRGGDSYKLTYRELLFLGLWFVSGFSWTLWFLPAFVYMRVLFVLAHKYNVMMLHMFVISQLWLTVPMFVDFYVGWKPAAPGAAKTCPAQCFCPFDGNSWVEDLTYGAIGMWSVGPQLIDHSFVGRALFFIPCYWLGFFTGKPAMKFLVKLNDDLEWKKRAVVALSAAGLYLLALVYGQAIESGFDDRCGSFWVSDWSLPVQVLKNIAFYTMNVITSGLYVVAIVGLVPFHLKRLAKTSFAAYIIASNTKFQCLLDVPVMALEIRKLIQPSLVPVVESLWIFGQPTLYVLTVGSLGMWLVQKMILAVRKVF
eukprot:gnl/MRDRNA2_/MRDRNA2_56185_c0_seq1.p1 gnl/MRDRNA2_/MRDRNA2_56185_c0~~gnl/MRDRNA2_/MRDRNA2_56185_c0_seq1.p1  ORF type:complete len:1270 (-),score=211.21 gnl/MRDRNA2_/MRDRNA2_56185_c0_seq1:148-3387(-)